MTETFFLVANALSLLLPILLSGIFFIFCIKKRWFEFLNHPIDAGLSLGGVRLFGPNKNWRAPVFYVVFGTGITYVLHFLAPSQTWIARVFLSDPLVLGLLSTIAYSGAELVNSFIKRRLHKPAGSPGGKLQTFFDNVDGAFASGIVLFCFGVPLGLLLVSFLFSFAVHAGTDLLMQSLKLKEANK